MGVGPQDETIAFLSNAASFGLLGALVERIETHCSIAFLIDDRAYKLKRAVAFSALLGRRGQRQLMCDRTKSPAGRGGASRAAVRLLGGMKERISHKSAIRRRATENPWQDPERSAPPPLSLRQGARSGSLAGPSRRFTENGFDRR